MIIGVLYKTKTIDDMGDRWLMEIHKAIVGGMGIQIYKKKEIFSFRHCLNDFCMKRHTKNHLTMLKVGNISNLNTRSVGWPVGQSASRLAGRTHSASYGGGSTPKKVLQLESHYSPTLAWLDQLLLNQVFK